MFSRIETFPEKYFAGMRLTMSFEDNRTHELWQAFMPHRKELTRVIGTELYSIEDYPPGFFEPFDPSKPFDKWAAVEVTVPHEVPEGMECLTMTEGLYAVFLHRGPASEGPRTYQYIFAEWLPASDYTLDERPHFAVMGDKYKPDAPESEEEIWIAVRPIKG